MRYRRFGRTGLSVSEIGFGAWGIGKAMWKGADDSESLRALHAAVDLGVNFIDTALAYGNGHSEALIGRLLRERKERLIVASKIPPKNRAWPARGSLEEAFPSEHIVHSVDASLRNLGTERIDLIQLHVWDAEWLREDLWFETLSNLREQGKIGYFGVSVNDHQPESAVGLVRSGKVDSIQVIYNIFDQSPEDALLALCLEKDVAVIGRVPFDEGSLTGKVTRQTVFPRGDWRNLYFRGNRREQIDRRVGELGQFLGLEAKTLASLALRFCLHHPAISTVIPGMRTVDHVRANCAAADESPLSEGMISELRRHRWTRNFYVFDSQPVVQEEQSRSNAGDANSLRA